jgi:Rab guanine nucleotide exchange factor SEC2
MVAAARKEREAVERRNEQLRAQLKDTEVLLASHQEQLAELKTVMQQMSLKQEDPDPSITASTAPSAPALKTYEPMSKASESFHSSPNSTKRDEILPAPPTSFSHLLHPVLRTDLQAYDDFRSLLQLSRKSAPTSRVTSGTYSGWNAADLAHLANRDQGHKSGHHPSNGSTSSIPMPVTHQSSPTSPSTPASTNSNISARELPIILVSLKETRFYKRVLTEDIEPALRLDTAPGLSWLARRSVINSMCEGSLIVEPMPPAVGLYFFSCSLCGENRAGDDNARSHRFRTSENESAQRYPLCPYCLNRVRASCDFLSFLRMVKDGHWRTDGAEAEIAAWEESVRLRERMFWARIGGGVIPAFVRGRDSPRSSVEEAESHLNSTGLEKSPPSSLVDGQSLSGPRDEPFHLETKPASGDNEIHLSHGNWEEIDVPLDRSKCAPAIESETPRIINGERAIATQFQNRLRVFQGSPQTKAAPL